MAAGAATGFGLIVLVFGVFIGWFARRAYGMHGDMKVNKARVPTFRGHRNRAGLVVIALIVLVLLFIKAAT
jgi:hypothetical protein